MVNRGVTLAGLAWAFTTFHAANWHPLTWISHMIDSQLFGMNAGGHLLVNALIHVANTLLVFWFLLRTTRARWSSALVAALFALHPLHVESVAWASERKDTLSTFFGLLSLIAYARYAEAPSIRRYAWVAITLALGLLAKPMLVTWPLVMLLLDYWPLRQMAEVRRAKRYRGKSAEVSSSKKFRCLFSWRRPQLSHFSRNLMEALCAHLPRLLLRSGCQTRLCRMRNTYCSRSGRMILRCIIRFSGGHTGLADHRRSVPADWNYGVLFFPAENPAVPHRRLALVSGNTGSCYRTRSGRRANHGGPLLLYSVDRFVHCARVRISGHREELASLRHGSAQE